MALDRRGALATLACVVLVACADDPDANAPGDDDADGGAVASDAGDPNIPQTVTPMPIADSIVAFAGVAAGTFAPERLRHFNRYAFPYVIQAAGPALRNVYATELFELVPGEQRIVYGGYDSADPQFKADRIFTATSTSFLSRPKTDFAPPVWSDRALTISNSFNGGTPEWIANDPSAVVLYYPTANPIPHPFMLYSAARQTAMGAENKIAWGLTDQLALDSWYPAERPTPGTNFITVGSGALSVNFMQRPSLVYDGTTFYLYYDQGGIADGVTADADCAPTAAAVNDCSNIGFNIHVATSTDGRTFTYQKETMASYAGAAEVERFSAGWIMFYDRIFDTIQYALSTDGLTFVDQGPVTDASGVQLKNPDGTITNTTVIRRGDRLLGLLYGEMPPLSDPRCAGTEYPVNGYCIDRGQVSAYFLQRKVVFEGVDGGGTLRHFETAVAFDEDRLELKTDLAPGEEIFGDLKIYEPDETTLILQTQVTLARGMLYVLE